MFKQPFLNSFITRLIIISVTTKDRPLILNGIPVPYKATISEIKDMVTVASSKAWAANGN